jgi:uncharacterized membrane protein
MYELWLFLHILGAIVAFGFGFYAPVFGAAAAREPQHGNWYMRTSKRLSNMILIPVSISMAITGTLLVTTTGGMRRFEELWLTVGVILYVIALLIVFLAQRPALNRVLELTSGPPAPGGPPPEVPALIRRLQVLGVALLVLVLAIVALMVWKPVL